MNSGSDNFAPETRTSIETNYSPNQIHGIQLKEGLFKSRPSYVETRPRKGQTEERDATWEIDRAPLATGIVFTRFGKIRVTTRLQ